MRLPSQRIGPAPHPPSPPQTLIERVRTVDSVQRRALVVPPQQKKRFRIPGNRTTEGMVAAGRQEGSEDGLHVGGTRQQKGPRGANGSMSNRRGSTGRQRCAKPTRHVITIPVSMIENLTTAGRRSCISIAPACSPRRSYCTVQGGGRRRRRQEPATPYRTTDTTDNQPRDRNNQTKRENTRYFGTHTHNTHKRGYDILEF